MSYNNSLQIIPLCIYYNQMQDEQIKEDMISIKSLIRTTKYTKQQMELAQIYEFDKAVCQIDYRIEEDYKAEHGQKGKVLHVKITSINFPAYQSYQQNHQLIELLEKIRLDVCSNSYIFKRVLKQSMENTELKYYSIPHLTIDKSHGTYQLLIYDEIGDTIKEETLQKMSLNRRLCGVYQLIKLVYIIHNGCINNKEFVPLQHGDLKLSNIITLTTKNDRERIEKYLQKLKENQIDEKQFQEIREIIKIAYQRWILIDFDDATSIKYMPFTERLLCPLVKKYAPPQVDDNHELWFEKNLSNEQKFELLKKVDIWCLGIIIYEIIIGQQVDYNQIGIQIVLKEVQQILKKELSGEEISKYIKILKGMLVINPQQRWNINKVLKQMQNLYVCGTSLLQNEFKMLFVEQVVNIFNLPHSVATKQDKQLKYRGSGLKQLYEIIDRFQRKTEECQKNLQNKRIYSLKKIYQKCLQKGKYQRYLYNRLVYSYFDCPINQMLDQKLQLSNILQLYLINCHIKEIPSFSNFPSLIKLSITGMTNNITKVTENLSEYYPNLQQLDLSYTNLQSFTVESVKKLKFFRIDYCKYVQLPHDFEELSSHLEISYQSMLNREFVIEENIDLTLQQRRQKIHSFYRRIIKFMENGGKIYKKILLELYDYSIRGQKSFYKVLYQQQYIIKDIQNKYKEYSLMKGLFNDDQIEEQGQIQLLKKAVTLLQGSIYDVVDKDEKTVLILLYSLLLKTKQMKLLQQTKGNLINKEYLQRKCRILEEQMNFFLLKISQVKANIRKSINILDYESINIKKQYIQNLIDHNTQINENTLKKMIQILRNSQKFYLFKASLKNLNRIDLQLYAYMSIIAFGEQEIGQNIIEKGPNEDLIKIILKLNNIIVNQISEDFQY